jgi:hypothetical protein
MKFLLVFTTFAIKILNNLIKLALLRYYTVVLVTY